MSDPQFPLPTDVHAALLRGEPVEAIKLLRQATGLGLKESKDIIDAYLAGNFVPVPTRPELATRLAEGLPPSGELPAEVLEVLAHGGKIAAIKRLRELTGLGLKEAKDAIDAAPVPAGGGRSRTPTVAAPAGGAWKLVLVLLALAVVAASLWHFLGGGR